MNQLNLTVSERVDIVGEAESSRRFCFFHSYLLTCSAIMCREAGAIEIVLSSFCGMTLAMVSLVNLIIFISFAIINEAAEFVMVVQDQQRFWASIAKLSRLCRYRPTYCPQGSRFCGACWTFVILRAWVEDEEKSFSYNYE